MSITVYSFLLVLLFAISNTIPIFNSIHTFPRLPLHISLSCPRIFSCLADGASSSCLVLSYIFTPPSSLPLFPSSHSDLFRLHLPHRWMTHLVQTPPFPCLADFAHRDLTAPRSGLGFFSRLAVHSLLLTPPLPLHTLRYSLRTLVSTITTPLEMFACTCLLAVYHSTHNPSPTPTMASTPIIPHIPYLSVCTLSSSCSTLRSIDRLYFCSLTQLSPTCRVFYPRTTSSHQSIPNEWPLIRPSATSFNDHALRWYSTKEMVDGRLLFAH